MEQVTDLNKDTLSGVQELIQINLDSHVGFRTVAEQVESAPIARLFRECSDERRGFANDLQRIVRANGETPETDGSIKGAAHRWWVSVRGMVQDGDEHAMLAEAERGEDAIKHKYEEVLREIPGNAVSDVLHLQYASVKSRHDQIRSLRDARAK